MSKTKVVPFDAALHVELWKQAVTVQQHFNDIGWRIRSIALTALTFTFGAAGLTYANTAAVHIGTFAFSAAALVPIFGVILWWAFWFMDAKWFHRLLIGAVVDGERLEKLLQENDVEAGLGAAITAASAVKLWPRGKPVRSTERLNLFYRIIAIVLGLLTIAILFIGPPPAQAATPELVPSTSSPPTVPTPVPLPASPPPIPSTAP